MSENRPVADKLLAKLQALGLNGVGSVLLEGLAPLAPLGAQFAYIFQPMFDQGLANGLGELARWLEQPDQVREAAERLREEGS